jgi:hypothetical protein
MAPIRSMASRRAAIARCGLPRRADAADVAAPRRTAEAAAPGRCRRCGRAAVSPGSWRQAKQPGPGRTICAEFPYGGRYATTSRIRHFRSPHAVFPAARIAFLASCAGELSIEIP